MVYLLLAALLRLVAVSAQVSTLNTNQVITLEILPNDCSSIVLDGGVPERASYSILPLVPTVRYSLHTCDPTGEYPTRTSSCGNPLNRSIEVRYSITRCYQNVTVWTGPGCCYPDKSMCTATTGYCEAPMQTTCGLPLQLSLPQDTKHLAWTLYDANTSCSEVREKTSRERSYGERIKLDFIDVNSPRAWGLTYHTCTDTSWEVGYDDIFTPTTTVGPVATTVFVYNPCDTPQPFAFNMTRLADGGAAEQYCNLLGTQNDGDMTVRRLVYYGGLFGLFISIISWCMCTVCCTCCCCCARPGWCNKISTPCSRGCFTCWGNLVTRCGCGWMMGRGGGMRFYTENQSTSLLFWSFTSSCMYAIRAIQFPQFKRDDIIDPEFEQAASTWGARADRYIPGVDNIKALDFLVAMQFAVASAVVPFVSMVLNFSDPLKDRSYRSKAILCGVLLLLGTAYIGFGVADSWRYYNLWEYKGHQIVLTIGLFFTHFMTMLSYIQFVWTTSKQRSAVKRAHGGKLPDLLPAVDAQDNVPNENLPVAEVVHTATHPGTYEQQPQLRPAQNVSENRNLSRGRGSNTPEIYIANRNPAFDTSPPGPDPFLDDSNTRRNSQKQIKFGYTKGRPGPVAEAALDRKEHSHGSFDTQPKGSELPADIPESAEATAAEAEKSRGVKGFFKRLWESVCEDRAIGFKYSVFVSSALLLTFITLTAAFVRMLHWVRQIADCTEDDSTCLHDMQLWFYRRFVQGLVKVDVETLELQLSGACSQLNATSTDPQFSKIAGSCDAVGLLNSAQEEYSNPEWISNAKTPVIIGGHIGFVVAYCLGLYTIFHVARAYKKLELKLRAAKLAELLFEKRSMDLADLRSSAPSSSAYTAGGTAKHKIGKNIVDDYKHVRIAQSAYFVGSLVSTVQVQLALAGTLCSVAIGALLHPNFWKFVGDYYWWPVSIVIIILWHVVTQALLNKYVTDGKCIKWPFLWLFCYVALSAAYCMVGLLIAVFRLVWLMITSIVALSRLDSCLFTVLKGRDAGYASFLAMALMLHALQDCLSEHNVTKESKQKTTKTVTKSSDALASEAVSKWKRPASSSAAKGGGQQGDQPTEIHMSSN